jgi:hypothetical protein
MFTLQGDGIFIPAFLRAFFASSTNCSVVSIVIIFWFGFTSAAILTIFQDARIP